MIRWGDEWEGREELEKWEERQRGGTDGKRNGNRGREEVNRWKERWGGGDKKRERGHREAGISEGRKRGGRVMGREAERRWRDGKGDR